MKYKTIINIRIFLLLILFLAACTTSFQHARIEISDDLSSSVQILISESVDHENIAKRREKLEELSSELMSCGASTRIFGGSFAKELLLQANIHSMSPDEVDIFAQCSTIGDNISKGLLSYFSISDEKEKNELEEEIIRRVARPTLKINFSNGLMSRIYTMKFQMNSSNFSVGGGFPNEFSFSMPGEIFDVKNKSRFVISRFDESERENSRSVFSRIGDEEQFEERLDDFMENIESISCKKEEKNCKRDWKKIPEHYLTESFHVEVSSYVPKYDLQTILALATILFGSGIVIEITRRIRSR